MLTGQKHKLSISRPGRSKGTLFSQTLKVGEDKVVLLLSVLPYFLRYGRFMNFFGQI